MKKILSLVLALLTLLSLAACDTPADTTVDGVKVTDPVATDAPDTEPPETLPTATETVPKIVTLLELDFETELSFADYIAATEGVSLNDGSDPLDGGEIKDGKWVYSGKPFAIKDELGIYSLDYYSIEFDFCFNSFVNKDSTSVFSLITDDDGSLGAGSNFYLPFRMDTNGAIYHNNAKSAKFNVEQGKTYHYKLEVNKAKGNVNVYIDDFLLVSPAYEQELSNYQCFRFMDVKRGADMWIDNIVVKDFSAVKNAATNRLLEAADGTFTRGGTYADQPQELAEGIYIDIKKNNDPSYRREGFLKFDISKLDRSKVKYAVLLADFESLHADSLFDIYLVSSDWSSETITYNSMPAGEKIFEGIKFDKLGSSLELTPYIREVLGDGEKYFSLRITPVNKVTEAQTRILYTDARKPVIAVYEEAPENGYFTDLTGDEEQNKNIWDHAEKMYDEWYERYKALPPANEEAVRLGRDESQYTKTNFMSTHSTTYATGKTEHKSRPLEALTDLDKYVTSEFKNAKLDKYGGIMVESLKQKATGYFYTVKVDGRWWMIDPLGYPFISIGLSDIHYSQLGSKLQQENAIKLYGDYDAWALATTKQVRDELLFNNSARPVSNIIDVDGGLPFIYPGSVMSSYGRTKGIKLDGNGSTMFTENNTMPVFDPDFVTYADNWAKSTMKYAGNDRLIGYTSDNELPMSLDMLDRAMAVNHTRDVNLYTYACTWTWLCNITGKDAPTKDDITDELRDLYRGFVWDRYLNVVSTAVKNADPDHMYMGTRFLTMANKSQWVYRFAAQYLDCMTINWYEDWEPNDDALYGISRNGDMPFIVTEFYTKAGDSGLGNTSGAGRYVETQTDRADFYETFTIRLLETPNCVGWQWFQYMDNDPNSGTGDKSSIDSNKGIYRSDYTLYTELTDRMTVLNKNVYNIIDYFANKSAK